jgi:hypothetical protein
MAVRCVGKTMVFLTGEVVWLSIFNVATTTKKSVNAHLKRWPFAVIFFCINISALASCDKRNNGLQVWCIFPGISSCCFWRYSLASIQLANWSRYIYVHRKCSWLTMSLCLVSAHGFTKHSLRAVFMVFKFQNHSFKFFPHKAMGWPLSFEDILKSCPGFQQGMVLEDILSPHRLKFSLGKLFILSSCIQSSRWVDVFLNFHCARYRW